MTIAEAALSTFVAGLTVEDLPAGVLERVRLHVLDAVACGLAGRTAEGRSAMEQVAGVVFGPGSATVLGGSSRAAGGAVLLNGFQIAAPTLGDVHRETLTHVMPEVLPAALATAERGGASGADLLAGLAAGLEVTVRVAEALASDAYRSRAWHNPGIAGAVGAACAAARVAGLREQAVGHAIGHAVSQAAGTFAALGTSGVKVHQARGGLSGFLAAQLAAVRLDASEAALTAPRGGLLSTYADGGDPERLTEGLGSRFRLEAVALRRWPGASSLQPVVEAALALRAELAIESLARVASVRVELPPRAFAMNGASGWATRLGALQSARWQVAVALADGAVWLDQTAEARLRDEAVARFAAERVTVAEDASLPPTGARLTLRDARDVTRTHEVPIPPGDPRRPLSVAEVRDKLDRAAAAAGLDGRAASIAAAVAALDGAASVESLLTAVRP